MKTQIGDNVRFLNAEGGGRVSRIDGKTIYVEDADGFEIPVLEKDVVVISETDYRRQGTQLTQERTTGKQKSLEVEEPKREEPKVEEPKYTYEDDATDDAEPRFCLALIRSDGGRTGTVDLYAVNDSNYFASYVIIRVGSDEKANVIKVATIEPNTKEKVDTLNPQQLDAQRWRVQLFMYKPIRSYALQPVYDVEVKPKAVKVFSDGSFVENDYFDEKALIMPVIKDSLTVKMEELTQKEIQRAIANRRPMPEKVSKPSNVHGVVEVDLHIDQLLESTSGLSNADMLKVQMDHVAAVMKRHGRTHGLKIVFIHGVGSGVLKAELLKYLGKSYPHLVPMDAPFSLYGFGATMVTI